MTVDKAPVLRDPAIQHSKTAKNISGGSRNFERGAEDNVYQPNHYLYVLYEKRRFTEKL